MRATPEAELVLACNNIPLGDRVSTFGYPFRESLSETNPNFVVNGRYLEGYVVRRFRREDATQTPCYELLPAPAGLSGAPILRINSRELVGIVIGQASVATVEEFARVDPATGERTPEVHRVQSFAVAIDTATLRDHRSAATDGARLSEIVAPGQHH